MPGVGIAVSPDIFPHGGVSGSPIPAPPYAVFSADGINVLTSISDLTYPKGSGPSPDSILFSLLGDGLSPAADNITFTPDSNFTAYFQIYNPNTSAYTSSTFNIPYIGGVENLPGFKIRLKAGLVDNDYSGTLTLTAPNTNPFILMTSGSVTFAYEPETTSFMTAAGIPADGTIYFPGTPQQITGVGLWDALNSNVLELKGQGIINTTVNFWNKFVALYPFIGGIAFTNKWNLKNPVDSDAAFRITWVGGMVFSEFGAEGNGTDAYGLVHVTPSVDQAQNNSSFFRFATNIVAKSPSGYNIGCGTAVIFSYNRDGAGPATDEAVNSTSAVGILSDGSEWVMHSRIVNTEFIRYASSGNITVPSVSTGLSTFPFAIFGYNDRGTIAPLALAVFGYCGFGQGLTPSEETLFRAIIKDFENKLNR